MKLKIPGIHFRSGPSPPVDHDNAVEAERAKQEGAEGVFSPPQISQQADHVKCSTCLKTSGRELVPDAENLEPTIEIRTKGSYGHGPSRPTLKMNLPLLREYSRYFEKELNAQEIEENSIYLAYSLLSYDNKSDIQNIPNLPEIIQEFLDWLVSGRIKASPLPSKEIEKSEPENWERGLRDHFQHLVYCYILGIELQSSAFKNFIIDKIEQTCAMSENSDKLLIQQIAFVLLKSTNVPSNLRKLLVNILVKRYEEPQKGINEVEAILRTVVKGYTRSKKGVDEVEQILYLLTKNFRYDVDHVMERLLKAEQETYSYNGKGHCLFHAHDMSEDGPPLGLSRVTDLIKENVLCYGVRDGTH